MKALTIEQQVNACIKHANRSNLKIDSIKIYPHYSVNHNVLMFFDDSSYTSVAVMSNRNKTKCCNESTWDAGRN